VLEEMKVGGMGQVEKDSLRMHGLPIVRR
jgi:hypothetical protein